jgi:hypothetical protein
MTRAGRVYLAAECLTTERVRDLSGIEGDGHLRPPLMTCRSRNYSPSSSAMNGATGVSAA